MRRGTVERTTADSLFVRLDSVAEVRGYARIDVTQFLVRVGRISVEERRRDRALTATKVGLAGSGVLAGASAIGCAFNKFEAAGDLNPCRVMTTGVFLGVSATIVAATFAYIWDVSETDRWQAAAAKDWQLSVTPERGARGPWRLSFGARRTF
jgi:hypothetical protein